MQATINGIRMVYDVSGAETGPPVVLHHSLAMNMSLWDELAAALAPKYRVIRFDARGHGQTQATKAPYTFEMLAADVVGLLDHLEINKAHFVGLSMGGMVGQWLGANAPERIERMVLTNTSSFFPDKAGWNERLKLVEEKGIAAFAAPNMARWFTAGFLERAPQAVAPIQAMFAATPLEGYLACGAAVRDMDHRALLPKITAPTLVIAGQHDGATPPEANEYIAKNIPGAEYMTLDAAHMSSVEQRDAYTDAVLGFLTRR